MKKLFAAIDVGSYELGMKIFELGGKTGIKEIDHVRHRIDLGDDTFHEGMISFRLMDELCEILKGFVEIMEGYHIEKYQAYGTSAIRETVNTNVVLDQIRLRTGLEVRVLSNSEQRFFEYKAVALRGEQFEQFIEKGTAFIDIGGGSTQVSLFDQGHLISSVNLHLGILRIRDKISALEPNYSRYEGYVTELVNNELHTFKRIYLSNYRIENVIVVDDYISPVVNQIARENGVEDVTAEMYQRHLNEVTKKAPMGLARSLGIPEENASLFMPAAIIVSRILSGTGAKRLWFPGVSLADGIAYDFAERNKYVASSHDFEKDILSAAENLAKRYCCSDTISGELVNASLSIFDGTRKIHGLTKRERLLLHLSARLRDVGKFVTLSSPAEVSYAIIMGTEIIGLSHAERKVVATVVKNSYPNNISYDEFAEQDFESRDYRAAVKLAAILRVATGLARSTHREYRNIKSAIKGRELLITVDTDDQLLLEKGLFFERSDTFEEVFGLKPVLKVKGGRA
ncbi:MAG: exopolyphosphatase [Lachnospiraceae bacterium]|nr:exopolyphosphatase [Lachnospiraceae bacterium]